MTRKGGVTIYTFDEYKDMLLDNRSYHEKSKQMLLSYFDEYLARNENAIFYLKKGHDGTDRPMIFGNNITLIGKIFEDSSFELDTHSSKVCKTNFIQTPKETILEVFFEDEREIRFSSIVDSHGKFEAEYAASIKELSYFFIGSKMVERGLK